MFLVVIEPDLARLAQVVVTRMIIVVVDVGPLEEVIVLDVMIIVIGALLVVIMMMTVADTVLRQELVVQSMTIHHHVVEEDLRTGTDVITHLLILMLMAMADLLTIDLHQETIHQEMLAILTTTAVVVTGRYPHLLGTVFLTYSSRLLLEDKKGTFSMVHESF